MSKRKSAWIAAAALSAIAAVIAFVVLRRGSGPPEGHPATTKITSAAGNAIELDPTLRDHAGIVTEVVRRGPLAPLVVVVGEAAFDPTVTAAVGTRAPGVVRKVFFVEGNTVEKNAVLAEIEAPGLAEAQADKRIAAAKKEAAIVNAQRESKLFERGLTTAREREQAVTELAEQDALDVAARERVAALGGTGDMGISVLRAPTSGIIAERAVAPGQNVGPGLVAFRVGSLDRLWVLLRVFERHLQVIRENDAVEIVPVAAPDRPIQGKVAHVGSVIDPSTHTADVRVEVSNEERILRPGQLVRATIRASGPARDALSVPASAITLVDGAPTIFVAESPTRFVARRVELGIDAGDRVEIKKGVREGEAIVERGVFALKSELFR